MALRGSLHEFELAEIFQLISRDGKTGQLVLSHNDNEAFVIFSQGAIVAAGTSDHNFQTILFGYLRSVRRYSEDELNELLYMCQGEMRQFSRELVGRNYLASNELVALARMAIEDLACSLFLWDEGNYRFDSLDGIQEYVVGEVTIPVDAITMEAMRRSDEWKRIRQSISGGTVFTIVGAPQTGPSAPSPLSNPPGYIVSLIDGFSTVDALCGKSILLPYRVYEILFGLWQNSAIAPLAVKRQQTKSPAAGGWPVSRVLAAAASVFLVAAWVGLLAGFSFVGQATFMQNASLERRKALQTVLSDRNARKTSIARLQFRAIKGYPASDYKLLLDAGLVFRNDLVLFKEPKGADSSAHR